MPLLLGVRGYGRQFSKAREWYRISRKCSYGFRFPLGRFRLMFCSVLLLSTAPALAELPSSLEIPFRCEDALLVPPERMQRMFVEAYFANELNGTEAAMQVYNPKDRDVAASMASDLLRLPKVRARIDQRHPARRAEALVEPVGGSAPRADERLRHARPGPP